MKKSPWLIFLLVAVAQFMVVLDASITNVALQAIRQSLQFNESALQWIVTAYALTFGGFLLLGGRAADLFGRRRMLLIGITGFTLFSLLIGVSRNPIMMVTLRALQGMAAALMSPAALSIVLTTFAEGKERNRALGLWTTVATGGAAVGLLLGGILTQYVDWRWNFFINVPVGILVWLGIRRFVPTHEQEERSHRSLDLPGAALITSSLIALVFAISQAPTWGWLSAPTLGLLGAVVVLLVGFVVNELRAKHPLMPLGIFKNRNVTGANLMIMPMVAGMMGMFFLTSLYFQTVLHYPPVVTGLAFLPFPIILGLVSSRVSRLVSRYGFKPFLIAGPVFIALGLAWLARLPVQGNYFVDILPTVLLMPFGIGLSFMPIITAATSGVPGHQAGLASGLLNTSQQMGGALGLAILSGVAASVTAGNMQFGALPALVRGYDVAFMTALGFMVVALILGAVVIRKRSNVQEVAPKLQEQVAIH